MGYDTDLQSIQDVRDALNRAKAAQAQLEAMSQTQIDAIVGEMAAEVRRSAEALAELAVQETGFGNVPDKVAKNLFVADAIYPAIAPMKTVGVIRRDVEQHVWEIAQPVGVIAGIVPSTNPTSTVMFKAMIALKARNSIVLSPHPGAKQCSFEAASRMQAAAERAGAPSYSIQCLALPTLEASQELMRHRDTDVILATGGTAMVKAAYSSGKPAYGVGPGNVPVYIHRSANVDQAASRILRSKTFDYGTICASEQAVVVDQAIKSSVIDAFIRRGAYMLSHSEKRAVEGIILRNGGLNSQVVGKSPRAIAALAGITIPDHTTVLIAEEAEVGLHAPFSIEKLSPILALYTVLDAVEGCAVCKKLLELGGLGHTLGIHAEDLSVIEDFGLAKPASRIVVNSGTTFGGIGMSTGIFPSLTLGCGSYGNNITSDNIGPQHLMNVKRVAFHIQDVPERESAQPTIEAASAVLETSAVQISREDVMEIVKRVLAEVSRS
ncbi:aldehyde dehydrogenase family protein [Paenibacillus guangzhouensis]|uniref:aldehyde dehydrogenase family protein n=1 Tax=Paenibacillus guangzhouensis TaxID=1473112 RepID=UPI001266AEC5|nr:aldehyde dehydrogenase family protein [Paenibacillus guangzhouensis]